MTTMITKIAQAIEAADGTMSFTGEPSEYALLQARAALTAMLEPTEAMLKAADTNVWFAQDASDLATLQIMLTEMIRAALDE